MKGRNIPAHIAAAIGIQLASEIWERYPGATTMEVTGSFWFGTISQAHNTAIDVKVGKIDFGFFLTFHSG